MVFRKRAPGPPPPPADPVGALDLGAVPARLVGAVEQAVDAYRRWQQVTGTVAPGPLADRLQQLGVQVQAGVLELYGTAARVGEVERILQALDPDGATAAYKAARRQASVGQAPPEMEALEARFASVQRMMNLVADAEEQLRGIDARLLAAVARGAEVAITADADAGGLTRLGADLDGVIGQLGAVRSALASFA